MKTDWNPHLRDELTKPYWEQLQAFVKDQRERFEVFPAHEDVFNALHTTPYAETRVVILGQDPYHGVGQAHGLCFSVQHGVATPPSLMNMLKELQSDLGCTPPSHGNLTQWAGQGVLLLNTTLTVRAHEPASHQGKGWETFTDEVIRVVSAKETPVVFLLWGAAARRKQALVDEARHVVVEAPHPSPLSAHRGFFGSKPFSRANEALLASGQNAIDWQITG